MAEISAYPLCWPEGQPRTPVSRVTASAFNSEKNAARDLIEEVKRLGGRNLIISSNVATRQDGQPYADAARRIIRDAGVAVYFDLKGEKMCFACDRWLRPWENIRAIVKSIEALRGLECWGSSDMVARAFRGYTALPPPLVTEPPRKTWREVFGYHADANPSFLSVGATFKKRAKECHPDFGGSDDEMAQLNWAMSEARKEFLA